MAKSRGGQDGGQLVWRVLAVASVLTAVVAAAVVLSDGVRTPAPAEQAARDATVPDGRDRRAAAPPAATELERRFPLLTGASCVELDDGAAVEQGAEQAYSCRYPVATLRLQSWPDRSSAKEFTDGLAEEAESVDETLTWEYDDGTPEGQFHVLAIDGSEHMLSWEYPDELFTAQLIGEKPVVLKQFWAERFVSEEAGADQAALMDRYPVLDEEACRRGATPFLGDDVLAEWNCTFDGGPANGGFSAVYSRYPDEDQAKRALESWRNTPGAHETAYGPWPSESDRKGTHVRLTFPNGSRQIAWTTAGSADFAVVRGEDGAELRDWWETTASATD